MDPYSVLVDGGDWLGTRSGNEMLVDWWSVFSEAAAESISD